jgi:AcrR family transcriptional regulator
MIVKAALPLVAERGAAVTTAQVARAAGIAEGTIFRVFPDKNALLGACIAEALDHRQIHAALASIELDQPLADRLIEAAEALAAHIGRIGAVLQALHGSGLPMHRPPPPAAAGPPAAAAPSGSVTPSGTAASTCVPPRDAEGWSELRALVIDLFEPDRERLRIGIDQAADMFISTVAQPWRPHGPPLLPIAVLVDVLLNGALAPERSSA